MAADWRGALSAKENSTKRNRYRARRRSEIRKSIFGQRRGMATLLAASVLLTGAAGCTPGHTTSPGVAVPTHTGSTPPGVTNATIVDPLSEITDKNNKRYVADSVGTILHVNGSGPSRYKVSIDKGTRSVRAYIACIPESHYTVTINKSFSGECAETFQAYADIPVQSGNVDAVVNVPNGTQFILAVIPTPR
jgi:hypothetical protein